MKYRTIYSAERRIKKLEDQVDRRTRSQMRYYYKNKSKDVVDEALHLARIKVQVLTEIYAQKELEQ